MVSGKVSQTRNPHPSPPRERGGRMLSFPFASVLTGYIIYKCKKHLPARGGTKGGMRYKTTFPDSL